MNSWLHKVKYFVVDNVKGATEKLDASSTSCGGGGGDVKRWRGLV